MKTSPSKLFCFQVKRVLQHEDSISTEYPANRVP
jgi:hypothetical protein